MRKLSGLLVLFLLLGAMPSLEAGLTFTAVPGTQVGDNLPVSLFVRADAGESLLSLDINSIQLSAGTFLQTAPTSSIPANPSFGSLYAGTIGSGPLNGGTGATNNINGGSVGSLTGSYLAFDPGTNPTLGYASISYNAAQPIPAADGLIASWIVNTAGVVGPTIGLTLSDFIPTDSSFGSPTVSFSGGNGLGGYSFNITAVPEPSSLMTGVGLALAGMLHQRRRRRSLVSSKATT